MLKHYTDYCEFHQIQSSFDVVEGNLHNFGDVMDSEIKFNNRMISNIEPLEIIK
jgi:hypothetical protein